MQIAGSAVDQRRFGSAQGVRAELEGVEVDAGDPLADEAGILTCREAAAVRKALIARQLRGNSCRDMASDDAEARCY
jgi:hypothetical protein